ncbi:hypothetical protein NBRC116602_03630 [Hyphomicrobiales bacterium 4NK60-0047b]
MVRVRGTTSNQNPRFGLAGGKAQTKMVPLSRETSNSLFEVFEEWHDHLKHVDFEELDKKYQESLDKEEDE